MSELKLTAFNKGVPVVKNVKSFTEFIPRENTNTGYKQLKWNGFCKIYGRKLTYGVVLRGGG